MHMQTRHGLECEQHKVKQNKILFIVHCLDMYGATVAAANMILDLKKRYHFDVFVIVPIQDIPDDIEVITHFFDKHGISYRAVPMQSWRTNFKGQDRLHILYYKLRKCFFNYKFIRNYEKEIPFEPDVIYSNSSIIDEGILLAISKRKKHIWHVREGKQGLQLRYIFPTKFVCRLFNRSDAVIAISKYIQAECRAMGIKKAECIYDGTIICPRYEKHYYYNGLVNFVVVANLTVQKRPMDVIFAAQQLRNKGYHNFKIHFVGTGTEREVMEQAITDYDLTNYVEMHGFVKDVNEKLCMMDIGIMASSYEGFGLATIEYMMNYLPVIGNDSGATGELLEGKEYGFIYPLGNIAGLVECMERGILVRKNIKKIGERARQDAEMFSVERNTDYIYQVINSVLER